MCAKLGKKCLDVLKGLQKHEHGWVFATPINPVELGIHDYFDVIQKPMDLGTVEEKLTGGSYHFLDDFQSDVCLVFENAMKYNEERTVVHEMAKELKKKFETDFKKLANDADENSKRVLASGSCSCKEIGLEPPVFFYNRPNCPMRHIDRNTNGTDSCITATTAAVMTFASNTGSIKSLMFLPDGKTLVSTGWSNNTLQFLDLNN